MTPTLTNALAALATRLTARGDYEAVDVIDTATARIARLEEALNLIAQWDISGPPLTTNDANIPPDDFPYYVAGRAHAELALIRNYARNSVARAALGSDAG